MNILNLPKHFESQIRCMYPLISPLYLSFNDSMQKVEAQRPPKKTDHMHGLSSPKGHEQRGTKQSHLCGPDFFFNMGHHCVLLEGSKLSL